jgi:hypothetical protein
LQKDFLSHILGILEVPEFAVDIGIDAGFVFVHKYAEGFRIPVETFVDYATVFRSHSLAPVYPILYKYPGTLVT